jgi:hypothetical protein
MRIGKMIQFFIVLCPGAACNDQLKTFTEMIDQPLSAQNPARSLITRSKRVSPLITQVLLYANGFQQLNGSWF